MTTKHSQTLFGQIRPLTLALAPLLLCLLAGRAHAGDDPEPFRPKGELVDLFARLSVKDPFEVSNVKNALWQRVGPKDVPLIAWMARRGQPKERKHAYYLLLKFKPEDLPKDDVQRRIVPAILDGLRSSDVDVRAHAVGAAAQYCTHSKALVDRLIALLDDREESYKTPIGATALMALTNASRTDDRVVLLMYKHAIKGHLRCDALTFMGRMGRGDGRTVSKVLPVLATVLQNPKEDVAVRQAAAHGLYFLGSRGELGYPILVKVFRDPQVKDAKQAAALKSAILQVISIACLGTNLEKGKPEHFKDLVPDLVKIVEGQWGKLEDEVSRRDLQGSALSVLQGLGPLAKAAVPALEKLLQSLPKTEPTRQFYVKKTLEAIKGK